MLILDKDRALDRMIWLSGRHALVVPEEFSHDHAVAAEAVAPSASDAAWHWSDALALSAPAQPRSTRAGPLPAAA